MKLMKLSAGWKIISRHFKRNNQLPQQTKHYVCPRCSKQMHVAECCAQDDEWLFVCEGCRETFTLEEIWELRD